jgi:hypothetical protein
MKEFYLLLIAASLLMLMINRSRLDKRLQLFAPLLIMALLADGLPSWLGKEHPLSKTFFTVYTPVEYTLQALVICSFLKNPQRRKIIFVSIPVFVMVALFIQLWLQQDAFYKYADILIQAPLICLWSMFYFSELAADGDNTSNRANPMFIISFAHILFFSAGFFSYGGRTYFEGIGNEDYAERAAWIGRAFNLVMYALYLTAFSIPLWPRKKYSY